MEETKSGKIEGLIVLLFIAAIITVLIGHFLFGWNFGTSCPSYDRTGEIVDDCL